MRRLGEVEPLELEPAHRREAEFLGARQHTLQRLARADRIRLAVSGDEVAEKERHLVIPGHAPRGTEIEARQCIRKAVLPADHRRVVVDRISHVPAEHNVAEPESALDR